MDGTRPAALIEDLAWYGAAPSPAPPMPELNDPAAALGALYVVEGSSLGARVIARALVDSLHVAPGRGGSFYCRQDADTARLRWRRVCAVLDQKLPGSGTAARLTEGALATFRHLEQSLRTIEIFTKIADAVAA
jgi:heme oxygenase